MHILLYFIIFYLLLTSYSAPPSRALAKFPQEADPDADLGYTINQAFMAGRAGVRTH